MIEAKAIRIELGSFQLGPLDFQLKSGKLHIIRGKNGSGKSSILKALSGRLRLKGGQLHSIPHPMGIIGLENMLMEAWSVEENWKFLSSLTGLQNLKFPEALTPWRNRRVDHLSAGQKRKSEIQILASFELPLYLLDEAFNVLDAEAKRESEKIFEGLLSKGTSLILTAHQETEFFVKPESILDL